MDATEYHALREWLRVTDNPNGFQAREARRKLKAYEREHGVPSEPQRRTLIRGYVAFWPDRPGQPRESKVVHRDRHCQHLVAIGDEYVREATGDELDALPPCGTCS